MFEISTQRVGLRKFCPSDLAPFAKMNSDPLVMEFFPAPLTVDESQAMLERIDRHFAEYGFGLWAAEHLSSNSLMGFVGIANVPYETDFTPAVEIGWRLSPEFWGQGLATEAAMACLKYGFEKLKLEKIVSFTATLNQRSYRVMERIGMKKIGEFDHPKIDDGHELKRHVLYQIANPQPQS